ncbi:transposase, partial [Escherichia coli]|uniref:transposase n=1 Tax=Escherichia coli TaxID=562 RepID=UPI001F038425
ILTFQNHTDCPLTDFGGKTSIFSHPVYLFLRKFSLQDSRGGSEEGALQALDAFGKEWDARYPQISRSWRANWPNVATVFVYPEAIRKVIYTTNAIESLNSVIRHAIKKRKVFPTDESVKKVVWLAIQSASQKWTMPLQDWRIVMSRFIIEFGDRPDGHF